ncbi:MAG: UDP-3-O-acyl-N-acetylglucosamine deacetylase [Alphaproteobacteria bacterium]
MPVRHQTTLASAASCRGVGLHTGAPVGLTLRPAPAGTGIVFVRADGAGDQRPIPARYDLVVGTTLCTTLGFDDGPTVGTVEHVMAALVGLGVDNATLDVDGPEVPVMDGSAGPFVELIDRAGITQLDAPRRVLRITRAVKVADGARTASLLPADGFAVSMALAYDGPPIGRQDATFQITADVFRRDIAPARTYGFLDEIAALRGRGLARGGSLDNAIVISGASVLNEEALRFPDEFVRHKILDGIGDLALAGAPIIGHFTGQATGHALNQALLRALFADPSAYVYETAGETAGVAAADGALAPWELARAATA